ncbi:oligosaccharide flippase family protein [uncultured Phocaeicola sp.]|uniref:oligosaccharide flippase family protein n=1 Tax=uncultured Phocaeicola sp. TaxID=990718 RepID=UPI0025DEF8EC|nr:oligosaccharide flippase family protein [uncultured Phocaeicola sp.]
MSENFSKERIVKNSLLLYVRMLFTMWLNLYATRLTLANLGIEDMGVYGVIGSIVSLFTVFTGGITSAVQRFITFELGLKDGQPNKVFCSSLNVIFILSGLMLVLLEVGGLWMLENKVNIPEASRSASFWVFQLSVLTCLVNLISIPYNALIIAHEKMNAFAVISIVQVVLNFLAAYSLSLFENNRLLLYAIMLAAASVLVRILYQIYCHRKFGEARYHREIDWDKIKAIGKFTGVSTISGVLSVMSGQGIIFIINWIFGVTINGVYIIALQLKNSILSFSQNILRAISPQIIKTCANNELELYKKLVCSGAKIGAFMLFFIMHPFLFRADYIMTLWLGNLPEYVVEFSKCIVFISLTYAIFEPIRTAVLATGKIMKFFLVPDLLYMIVLPISFIVGKLSSSPIYTIITIVSVEIIICMIRIYYATIVTPIKLQLFFKEVLIPCVMVFVLSYYVCLFLSKCLTKDFEGLVALVVYNSISLLGIIYMLGLTRSERSFLMLKIKKICNKL